jgi:hypothetical protein
MTLPERQEQAPRVPEVKAVDVGREENTSSRPGGEPTEKAAPPRQWAVGDRVLAPWSLECLAVGISRRLEGGEALIAFEGGDVDWAALPEVQGLDALVGRTVSVRGQADDSQTGEALEVRDDAVRVTFESGRGSWVALGAVRVARREEDAQRTPDAQQEPSDLLLQPGARVFAPWEASLLFAGTVSRFADREVLVHFDALERSGWVLREQLMPLELAEGAQVVARRGLGTQYFPATVVEMQGDSVLLSFDEEGDDQEWTPTRAICVACEPRGPDARAFSSVTAVGNGEFARRALGIAVVILLVLLRAGCR